MRRLAGTVNIITTCAPEEPGFRGLTATAVCSVTAAPPTVLVCVNKASGTHDAIMKSGVFCVNALSSTQADIAELFSSASSPRERFRYGRWSRLLTGAPVLHGCVANFDCTVLGTIGASTHTIFLGSADAITEDAGRSPLIYSDQAFACLAPISRDGDEGLV